MRVFALPDRVQNHGQCIVKIGVAVLQRSGHLKLNSFRETEVVFGCGVQLYGLHDGEPGSDLIQESHLCRCAHFLNKPLFLIQFSRSPKRTPPIGRSFFWQSARYVLDE